MALQQSLLSFGSRLRASLLLTCVLTFVACDEGGKSGDEGTTADQPALKASAGSWEGSVLLEPWPAVVGDNKLELVLTDEHGEPLEGATVKISPWMPAHGHGSVDVTASEGEPGHYATDALYLNMPGLWELRVHVTRDGEEGRLVASFEAP